jgi:hypothetical protein
VELVNDSQPKPQIARGTQAFKIYLDQLRVTCPDISDQERSFAAAVLAGVELFVVLVNASQPHVVASVDSRMMKRQ